MWNSSPDYSVEQLLFNSFEVYVRFLDYEDCGVNRFGCI